MRTKLYALTLALGLGLLGTGATSTAAADTRVQVGQRDNRVVPGRTNQLVRTERAEARHRRGVVAEVPELSASLAAQGLCLLLGATLLIHERRRRTA